jgi:hypothetical protein
MSVEPFIEQLADTGEERALMSPDREERIGSGANHGE